MFKCEACGRQVEKGITPILKVIEKREKFYPPRFKNKVCIDKGGMGFETVKELKTCGCLD